MMKGLSSPRQKVRRGTNHEGEQRRANSQALTAPTTSQESQWNMLFASAKGRATCEYARSASENQIKHG